MLVEVIVSVGSQAVQVLPGSEALELTGAEVVEGNAEGQLVALFEEDGESNLVVLDVAARRSAGNVAVYAALSGAGLPFRIYLDGLDFERPVLGVFPVLDLDASYS